MPDKDQQDQSEAARLASRLSPEAIWKKGGPNGSNDVGRCELVLEDGTITRGAYEFEDEIYDPQTGDEFLIFVFKPDEGCAPAIADDAVEWRSLETPQPRGHDCLGSLTFAGKRYDFLERGARAEVIVRISDPQALKDKIAADPARFALAFAEAVSGRSMFYHPDLLAFGVAVTQVKAEF